MNNLKVIKGGKRIEKGSLKGVNIELETCIPKELWEKAMTIGLTREEVDMLYEQGLNEINILE